MHAPRRHRTTIRARRGSTIIVAVGVLSVLALVAVSYALAVRIERSAATSARTGGDIESAGRLVRDEIGAILTADLFGNKLVTPDTPVEGTTRVDNYVLRVWPRMFEDGEYFDVPQTAPGTFDARRPDEQAGDRPNRSHAWVIAPMTSGAGPYFPSAPARDDAWLSNTEPHNHLAPSPRDGVSHLEWTTWGQLTNLRSVYRWVRDGANDRDGYWVRDDGRFADLAQFFLSDFARAADRLRGDPGANLSYADDSDGLDAFTNRDNGPAVALSTTIAPGTLPATALFDFQLHQFAEEFFTVGDPDIPELTGFDERFFTDTDGDLRIDARWQTLDTLDGVLGLRWVVAARIIDNSALVNVNTALEFQDPVNPTRVGDGRTPADVDLYRLLRAAHLAPDLRTLTPWNYPLADPGITLQIPPVNNANSAYNEPRNVDSPFFNPFNQHLVQQLAFSPFTQSMADDYLAPSELVWSGSRNASDLFQDSDMFLGSASSPHMAPAFTTRLQRYFYNRYFASTPQQPRTDLITPYPIADEADLRAFFGVNDDRGISRLEQRFDYTHLDLSSLSPFSGPLRAKEPTAEFRAYAADPADPAQGFPTVRAIASDTRRHLTTVSGAGDFSPVPVLNDWKVSGAPVFSQPFLSKINLLKVPRVALNPADSSAGPGVQYDRFRRARAERNALVRDAFSAFAWALAPLAGHRPLMAPLNDNHTGWSIAQAYAGGDEIYRFFYGGDRLPATGPAYTLGQQPNANADPGASYAILRAASLAINLLDATDDDRLRTIVTQAPNLWTNPTGANAERPTVARLYNINHPNPYAVEPAATPDARRYANLPDLPIAPADGSTPDQDHVIRLGVSFPWGDLRALTASGTTDARVPPSNEELLPPEFVGDPIHGVTLVGLDRQPFLRQVSVYAIYADRAAITRTWATADATQTPPLIDPAEADERVGVLVAWELGNPWSEDIDVDGLTLAIAQNDVDLLSADIRAPSAPRTTTIPPGGRAIFYAVHWSQDPGRQEAVEAFETMWIDSLADRLDDGGADDVRRIEPADGEVRGLRLNDGSVPADGVPFQDWAPGAAVALLYIRQDASPTVQVPGAGYLVLDRLAPNGGSGGIPLVLDAALPIEDVRVTGPNERGTGEAAVVSTLHRPTQQPGSGFPVYVIERPSENTGKQVTAGPGVLFNQWVITSAGGMIGFEEPGALGAEATQHDDLLGTDDKGAISVAGFPPFQLFVPNTELRYASELLQLTAFTHMYVHNAPDPDGAILGPSIAEPAQAGAGTWRTVSEQLGSDAELFRNAGSGNSVPNPYLGVLDPTRFALVSENLPSPPATPGLLGPVASSNGEGLPEALALPLALRVVDCFEALWTPEWAGQSRLVQGRVNINTAAQKTLRMLPLVDPIDTIGPLMRQSAENGSAQVANDWRVPMLLAYRERTGAANGEVPDDPSVITGMFGAQTTAGSFGPLRYVDLAAEFALRNPEGGAIQSRGFVTPGELAILGRWQMGSPQTPDASPGLGLNSFLQLGADSADITGSDLAIPTLDVRRQANADDALVRPTPLGGGSLDAFDGVDDVEERLALYRAISNIVTSRSDVYTAYFKVRGYAPQDIEAIQVEENPTDQQIDQYLQQLRPRYEARYLAVYDRSNVRTPLDRPRVLLYVRLPD